MITTWIMQTNMGSLSDIQDYVKGVRESGANVIEVDYTPFSGVLPDITINGPVIVYGSTGFIREAQKAGLWSLGIFETSEIFAYEECAKNYGDMLLNSPDGIELTTVGGFCSDNRDPDEDIFVKPQHDTKSLAGEVWTAGEFKNWCMGASKGDYAEIDATTPILVAKPYGIEAEWRLFVVDNKVVGASQYQKNRKTFKSPGAPQDILDFAAKVIERWNPAPVYTLDLCRSAGNCYIVEAQGFNSAGTYACDMKEVAQAVNEVAIRLWNSPKIKSRP